MLLLTQTRDANLRSGSFTPAISLKPKKIQFPNEIIECILLKLNDNAPIGSQLDEEECRKAIWRFRLVNRTWNSLILFTFFRRFRVTSGFFPPGFDARDPMSAQRICDIFDDPEDQRIFGLLESNLEDLHRSDFFRRLGPSHYDNIRWLTIEVSCTIGDIDPKNACIMHKEFAKAAVNCKNVETITINCHGQARLDSADSGLDTYFAAWNYILDDERVFKSQRKFEPGVNGLPFIHKRIPYPDGPIFPRLRELQITGKSGCTKLTENGIQDLLKFVNRHKDTLQVFVIENVGVKRDLVNSLPSEKFDRKTAVQMWSDIRDKILKEHPTKNPFKRLDFKSVVYTAIRDGPAPEVLYKEHAIEHYYDWPYETDVVLTCRSIDEYFRVTKYRVACGCETPEFKSFDGDEGEEILWESQSASPNWFINPLASSNIPWSTIAPALAQTMLMPPNPSD
ncbi:hypothetical protein ABW20_dc0110418 [Dactylellina cionopaga]|nr:hypothetical protein ABW20_dc0110418 [Dactylellina cionopaga]